MTPEKFFDYLEGKLPPDERELLERALIADPDLQREFVRARQIHRGLQRPADETANVTRAGVRGRQVAVAFAVLVAMNVALGLIYIFHVNKPPEAVQQAKTEALRHQLQSSVEKAAAAAFPAPSIGMERITLTAPRAKQDEIAGAIIAAATKAGGSGTKSLPNDNGLSVLILIPASSEAAFRAALTVWGAAPPPGAAAATPAPLPDEPIRLEIVLSSPP